MLPVNCYVLWDDTLEAVVVDAGMFFPGETQAMKDFLNAHHLQVKHLLNTHLHFDHVLGNAYMWQEYGLRTEAAVQDEYCITDFREEMHRFGIRVNGDVPAVGHYLEDGEDIAFGHTHLAVLHVPGHSPGSVAFYHAGEHCVLTGDTLFKETVGRTDLKNGNYKDLMSSIHTKLLVLPDDTVVWPGHGDSTTIGHEKLSNPYL